MSLKRLWGFQLIHNPQNEFPNLPLWCCGGQSQLRLPMGHRYADFWEDINQAHQQMASLSVLYPRNEYVVKERVDE